MDSETSVLLGLSYWTVSKTSVLLELSYWTVSVIASILQVLNHNPQFVKKISPDGSVEHINWHNVYDKIRGAAGFSPPGIPSVTAIAVPQQY